VDGERITGSAAYAVLIDPYLSDPADASMVDDLRAKVAEIDRENERRLMAKQPLRVAMVSPRRFLERHDAAISWLAWYLEHVDLYVVFPRRMSETEAAKIEHQNAEIYAVFQRLRVSGLNTGDAITQTAEDFGVSQGAVERIVEFRLEVRPDQCSWGGCERAPFSQNLCQKHYQQRRRERKKQEFCTADGPAA
jgi:hypothetical protein